MYDYAAREMKEGFKIAAERISGVNDNMSASHYHEFYELYYLESGIRKHLIGDQLYEIQAGEFLLFEPYVLHHSFGDADIPFCRLLVYFRESELVSGEIRRGLQGASGAYQLSGHDSHQFQRIMNLLHVDLQHPQDFSEEYRQSLVNALAITVIRNKSKRLTQLKNTLVTDIISYIHLNYMYDLSLEKIASHFYISTFYLCHEFNKYTGSTIVRYLNKTRILNAQQLLLSTSDNITEISVACGFSSVTHFGRVFKELTGTSPSKWRKLH